MDVGDARTSSLLLCLHALILSVPSFLQSFIFLLLPLRRFLVGFLWGSHDHAIPCWHLCCQVCRNTILFYSRYNLSITCHHEMLLFSPSRSWVIFWKLDPWPWPYGWGHWNSNIPRVSVDVPTVEILSWTHQPSQYLISLLQCGCVRETNYTLWVPCQCVCTVTAPSNKGKNAHSKLGLSQKTSFCLAPSPFMLKLRQVCSCSFTTDCTLIKINLRSF